jgi:hypothetical protein
MKPIQKFFEVVLLAACLSMTLLPASPAFAQTAPAAVVSNTASTLPHFVRFNGTAKDLNGSPLTGVVGITFALYAEQDGGAPLWLETQNAQADSKGHYSVVLGATKPDGLPAELFTSEQARWVGVQLSGQAEQPRVLLVSAAYALKAGDAETIGGLPPSAFVLAVPSSAATSGDATSATAATAAAPQAPPPAGTVTGSGTADFIPLWTTTSNLANSVLFQSGAGATARIGVNTGTPASTLDVKGTATVRGVFSLPPVGTATAAKGADSQALSLTASAFNSSTSTAANQNFRWQVEPVGNDTTAPSGTLNLLFAEGTGSPAETGLNIASNGLITFAPGQVFPAVAQLHAANTFTANQTVDGTMTATSFSGNGSGLTNVTATNSSELGGLNSTAFAQLTANNTFSGTETMSGSNSSGVLQVTNTATSGAAPAVVGTTDSTSAAGVKGIASATTGTSNGVVGSGSSPTGIGVKGEGPNVGVNGQSSGESVTGANFGAIAGVWGDTGAASESGFSGVTGTADDNFAGVFLNNAPLDVFEAFPAVLAENDSNVSGSFVFETYNQTTGYACVIDIGANLSCDGMVSGEAKVDGGARRVSLYAMQSPENWFEDFGSGTLANGAATVTLDPTFAQTVNTASEYHVFLTPKGDSEGLYVSNETPQGFEVHEQRGGHSNVAFDYRIVAKRAGYEKLRLADVTEQYKKIQKQQQLRHERMERRGAARSATGVGAQSK